MAYSIGEISRMFDLSVSTLRFYDKEGLLPNLKRDSSGLRVFDEQQIETLSVIECLKKSGMQIKDIKEFMHWVSLGEETVSQRRDMFLRQKENIENKISELENALELIKFKCWYYETAEKIGEEKVKTIPLEERPEETRKAYKNSHL